MKIPELITVFEIDHLGAKGDGITTEGVFVTGALPGETVEGSPIDGRLASPRILTPSGDRVRPPCRHAKSCGGCQVQHATDDFVANWKTGVITQALARVGLNPDVRPIATSSPATRRRAALSGRRTKSGAMVGFHARATDTIVPITDCTLLSPRLLAILPTLEQMTVLGASRKSEVSFHVTDTDVGVDVFVTGARGADFDMIQTLADMAEIADLARLVWNDDPVATRRKPFVTMGNASVPIPPGAFLQATAFGQATLVTAVAEILIECGDIVDLFAGTGTFALPLAETAQTHAVEGDAALLKALSNGWRMAKGLKLVTTEARDLYRNPLLPDELTRFDGAVIDPPRAGAVAQTQQIVASNLNKVAFVSCNPATFARDARTLTEAGFSLDWVMPVDQFRWSVHVELVASFSREKS